MNFVSRNKFIIVILAITVVKGIIWAYVVPPFHAPDEQVHYAEIQYYAEPAGYAPWNYDFPLEKTVFFDIDTQNISPELRDYLERTDFDRTRFNSEEEYNFRDFLPFRDKEEKNGRLSRFEESYPVWITNYPPLYYQIGALIENMSSSFGIAERSFFIRLFSVFLSAVFVFFAYLTFRELSLEKTSAVLLSGAVSFQPMLTFITASINVDPFLFASFGIFLWGAVRILKRDFERTGITALAAGTILSVSAKPSGYFSLFVLPVLLAILAVKNRDKIRNWDNRINRVFWIAVTLVLVASTFLLVLFYQSVKSKFFVGSQPLSILDDYILHQLEYPVFLIHSLYYWGNFAWLSLAMHPYYVYAVWAVMALAIVGILKCVWQAVRAVARHTSARRFESPIFYQTAFLIFVVTGFFLMIHAVNFQQVNPNNVADESAAIAIQGRYFFPVMAAKFYLIFWGLSSLFPKLSEKTVTLFLFSFMVVLNLAGLLLYIVPRYYL